MRFPWKRGQAIIAILCVMLMLVLAACGSDDDDNDNGDTATPAAATSTSGSSAAESTATTSDAAADDDDATATSGDATATEPAAGATGTTAQATQPSQATATEADTEDPTATVTATTGSGSTATEPAGATATTGGGMAEVPEFETLDPELLPNFSFSMNFTALNYGGMPETVVEMEIRQSEVGASHMRMVSDGEEIEFWTIDGRSWMGAGGEVIESPGGALFTPADLLTTGEVIPSGLNAERQGTETVNGRETTRWVVDGDDYIRYMAEELEAQGTPMEMSDGQGEVTVWVDNELNTMLKADGDVSWKNGDGTDGSIVYLYEVFDIGSTDAVTAPQ